MQLSYLVNKTSDAICFPRVLNCVCLLPRFIGALVGKV